MDIYKLIGNLPFRPKKGFVLPSHKYTGPYNNLKMQLDENDQPLSTQKPFNKIDKVSMKHDICYRDHSTKQGRDKCDEEMISELEVLKPENIREKIDRKLVQSIMKAKRKTVVENKVQAINSDFKDILKTQNSKALHERNIGSKPTFDINFEMKE